MNSKKLALPLGLIVAIAIAAPAHAGRGDTTVGASLDVAGPPVPGWGTALGFTVEATHEFDRNVAAIGSVSFYQWNQSPFGDNIYYRRVPIDGGIRFYLPVDRHLRFFLQAEGELSFDEVGFASFPNSRTTNSDVRVGFVPGLGLDYRVSRQFSLLAAFKYHVVTDDYYVFSFGGAFHF